MDEIELVITGAAAICSLGVERQAIVEAMRAGADGFASRPAPEWTGRETMTAAWVRDFKASPTIPPMKARRMARSSQMTIVAADAALRQAGWDVARQDAEALGIFVGSGFCGTHSSLSIVQTICAQGPDEVSAAAFPNTVPNAPAGQLAIFFGLEGPSATLLQTGTTGEGALLCAREQLARDQCRAGLWGGVDELSEYLWFGWRRLGWIGEPAGDRLFGRPHHRKSVGFLPGEAAAVMVVESAAAARRREAAPLAVIEWLAAGAVDAPPWAYPDDGQIEPAVAFFRTAVEATGMPDLVLGCGNGHPRLDRLEAEVLGRLLDPRVPVWFPKGQVGEGMASTALRTVLAVWLIEEGFVPGNVWLADGEPAGDLAAPATLTSRPITRVLLPTVSAGGTLGAVVIARPGAVSG